MHLHRSSSRGRGQNIQDSQQEGNDRLAITQNEDFDDESSNVGDLPEASRTLIRIQKDEKLFSLTLLTPERGQISLPAKLGYKPSEDKALTDAFKKKDLKVGDQPPKDERLKMPCPKFSKVGDMIYCVYNANIMSVSHYNKDTQPKKKKLFEEIRQYSLEAQIKFVKGNRKLILAAFETGFLIIHIQPNNKLGAQLRMQTDRILGGYFQNTEELVIVTVNSFTRYCVFDYQINVLSSYKIDLKVGPTKFIEMLKDPNQNKYLLLVAQRKKVTYNTQSKFSKNQNTGRQIVRDGEVLQVIELGYQASSGDNVYEVSTIPEQGMFELSKAFYLGEESFLLSLFEEVIVVRKQFQKYIVVDNTAVVSMNVTDDAKAGQLVLVDRQKVVFNDQEGINVYNLLYVPREDKIKMESVDNFAAIDQNQLILYDGLLLTHGDTNVQVLFYFDNRKITRPGKRNIALENNDEKEDQKHKLRFSIYAIVQSQPIERLIELLKLKRPQSDINQFRNNFHISPLEFYKSQWSVSEKSLNDIINNLLQISDQSFIETELDTVLKKQPITLNFLIKIQEKQVSRLKKVIIEGVEKRRPREELEDLIKKLLESKMFLKKLRFQNQFEAYKLIDFIEINKLREMSLKEQIKLLSSKGYEKRLKQFLNQFKYLAIANFEDIFTFLMENKDEKEAKFFLAKMGFMFPHANDPSKVKEFAQINKDRQQRDPEDSCYLWEDFEINGQRRSQPQTVDSFISQLFPQGHANIRELAEIMERFKNLQWFKEGAFKKHCKLSIKNEELLSQFHRLKNYKVYNILYKYLFQNIHSVETRKEIISSLEEEDRLPLSFRVNKEIKEKVYYYLEKQRLLNPPITLPNFLILNETEYFNYLTVQNAPSHMLFVDIKNMYQNAIRQLGFSDEYFDEQDFGSDQVGFFEECFQNSMKGKLVELSQLKFYLKEFTVLGSEFHCRNQGLLNIILEAVKRKLRINGDSEEIIGLITTLFRIDLLGANPEKCSVLLEIAFFNEFFSTFHMDYSFAQLDAQQLSAGDNNTIIFQAIEKYCKNDFDRVEFDFFQLLIDAYDKQELIKKKANIKKPKEFFEALIYMTNQIGFEAKPNLNMIMLQHFLICMLQESRFEEINQFNVELSSLVKNKDSREFFEELIIKHVRQLEKESKNIGYIYDRVVNSLSLVNPITIKIKQERAFLDLSKNIGTLDDSILQKFPSLREDVQKPALVFMMSIWLAADIEAASRIQALKTRQILESIYEKYKQVTSLDLNFKARAASQVEFLEFEVERGYQYIERTLLQAALDICKLLSNQDRLYFNDLLYSVTCEIVKKIQSPSDDKDNDLSVILVNYCTEQIPVVNIVGKLEQVLVCQEFSDQHRIIRNIKLQEQKTKTPDEKALWDFFGSTSSGIVNRLAKFIIQSCSNKVYYEMFFHLLEISQVQAFFFLMKNKSIQIGQVIKMIEKKSDLPNEETIPKYLSLAIYVRSLSEVVKDFYPTYTFFQKKQTELSSDKVKRDINILASKLKLQKLETNLRQGQKQDTNPEKVWEHLMKYYNIYMELLGLSGYVDLTNIKMEEELDVNNEMAHISKEYLKQKQQIEDSKRKYEQLMRNINSKPKPLPIPTSQNPAFRSEDDPVYVDLPSKRLEKFQDIKRRELANLKKVEKEFVRQESSTGVDKILQMFKERKQQRINNIRTNFDSIKEETNKKTPTTPARHYEHQGRAQEPLARNQELHVRSKMYPAQKGNDQAFQIRERVLEAPVKQRVQEQLRKRNIVQKPQKPYSEKPFVRSQAQDSMISDVSEIKSLMDDNVSKAFRQQTLRESSENLKKFLSIVGEDQVLRYFLKFELVNENMTLCRQFVKKMFETSKHFNTWIRVIEFIMKNYKTYSKVYEIKTLKLCSQSLKIDAKVDPKQLFDLAFFSHVVPNASQQDYNSSVFAHLKANIMKLVNENNVHALSKAFFYGMGLNKKYEYMVYVYYLDALMEEYLCSPFNPKQELCLVEKLKSVYCKLGPQMRDQSVKGLMRSKLDQKGGEKIKSLTALVEEGINRAAKLKNITVPMEDQSLLKLLKSV